MSQTLASTIKPAPNRAPQPETRPCHCLIHVAMAEHHVRVPPDVSQPKVDREDPSDFQLDPVESVTARPGPFPSRHVLADASRN